MTDLPNQKEGKLSSERTRRPFDMFTWLSSTFPVFLLGNQNTILQKAHFPLQCLMSRGPRGCLKPMNRLPTLGNKTGTLPSGLFNTRLCLRALTEHIWVMEVLCPVWSQSRSKHPYKLRLIGMLRAKLSHTVLTISRSQNGYIWIIQGNSRFLCCYKGCFWKISSSLKIFRSFIWDIRQQLNVLSNLHGHIRKKKSML